MPSRRTHDRLDRIADAATEVFIQQGFDGAKISQVAQVAQVAPGTVYLYTASKEALFDLALRRALQDPTLWSLSLPHPTPAPGAVAEALWRCLQNVTHFPQLWLATESPPPVSVASEVEGIVGEFYAWLHRYRRAVQLVHNCAGDWPQLAQLFYRRFWRGGARRLADYFRRRIGEGKLPARGDPLAAAHFVIESLAWMAVHREWAADGAEIHDAQAEATAIALLVPAIVGHAP
jgi:AcrR family transcriptional regulator